MIGNSCGKNTITVVENYEDRYLGHYGCTKDFPTLNDALDYIFIKEYSKGSIKNLYPLVTGIKENRYKEYGNEHLDEDRLTKKREKVNMNFISMYKNFPYIDNKRISSLDVVNDRLAYLDVDTWIFNCGYTLKPKSKNVKPLIDVVPEHNYLIDDIPGMLIKFVGGHTGFEFVLEKDWANIILKDKEKKKVTDFKIRIRTHTKDSSLVNDILDEEVNPFKDEHSYINVDYVEEIHISYKYNGRTKTINKTNYFSNGVTSPIGDNTPDILPYFRLCYAVCKTIPYNLLKIIKEYGGINKFISNYQKDGYDALYIDLSQFTGNGKAEPRIHWTSIKNNLIKIFSKILSVDDEVSFLPITYQYQEKLNPKKEHFR